jgi:hypothetical protein
MHLQVSLHGLLGWGQTLLRPSQDLTRMRARTHTHIDTHLHTLSHTHSHTETGRDTQTQTQPQTHTDVGEGEWSAWGQGFSFFLFLYQELFFLFLFLFFTCSDLRERLPDCSTSDVSICAFVLVKLVNWVPQDGFVHRQSCRQLLPAIWLCSKLEFTIFLTCSTLEFTA